MFKCKTKIAILMATFNGEKYVSEQIESIINQSFNDWTLYIHDDNSNDNTKKIILEYANKYQKKIIFINDNIYFKSSAKNFSHLINLIDADYIMLCDQDDVWLKDKIYLSFNQMIELEKTYQNIPLLVHTDLIVVDMNLNSISNSFVKLMNIDITKDSLNKLLVRNIVTGCTMLFNRNLLKLVQPMPDAIVVHDWWIALVASIFGRISFINQATLKYRQHQSNSIGIGKKTNYFVEILSYDRRDYYQNINQGKLLNDKYLNTLPNNSKNILHIFINLSNFKKIFQIYFILKYRFLYHKTNLNIGLILKLMKHKIS